MREPLVEGQAQHFGVGRAELVKGRTDHEGIEDLIDAEAQRRNLEIAAWLRRTRRQARADIGGCRSRQHEQEGADAAAPSVVIPGAPAQPLETVLHHFIG